MEYPFEASSEIKMYFKNNYVSGNNKKLQQSLDSLRKKGCSQMESVMLLMIERGLSFAESNRMVLNSKPRND
jgi:hypothetical protein